MTVDVKQRAERHELIIKLRSHMPAESTINLNHHAARIASVIKRARQTHDQKR